MLRGPVGVVLQRSPLHGADGGELGEWLGHCRVPIGDGTRSIEEQIHHPSQYAALAASTAPMLLPGFHVVLTTNSADGDGIASP